MENKLKELEKKEQEEALLSLTVCDPSCGTGNFLVEATRLMARRLTTIRLNDELDINEVSKGALKDVLQQCIYGVDLNPLTVEICKIVLWLELEIPNQSFAIFRGIQCGNALLGLPI